MAPHSSTLAWKIPWTEEPGRLQSMGSLELDTTEQLHFHFSLSRIGGGNGNPLQCSCLENPRDGGAWWADVYGVAQSWTRLKQLSSSRGQSALSPYWDKDNADRCSSTWWVLLPSSCWKNYNQIIENHASWGHMKKCKGKARKKDTIPYDITYKWNLKYGTNQHIYGTETDSQIERRDLLPVVEEGRRGKECEFLLHIGWINSKVLLYGTRDYI